MFNDFGGAYSSGSVQDFHLIPFSSLFRRTGFVTPKPETKVKIILINNRSEGAFFRISVRFCCSAKASMTSDMTGQTDLWGENL